MAARGWASSVLTAIGVAAGAGAAQLGLAYGLGTIGWQGDDKSLWLSSLAWVLWVAATSTVIGAISADRRGSRDLKSTVDGGWFGRRTGLVGFTWRTVIALAAASGSVIVVPLVAVPTRSPPPDDGFALQVTAGACAAVGVILGLFLAIGALSARAIAANVVASICWIWALAVIAVVGGVPAGRALGSAQVAIWKFTDRGGWRDLYPSGAPIMLTVALLIGALAAWPAARRGDNQIGVAMSGAVGPALVAVAYLVAAPSLSGVASEPKSAFVAAYMIAPHTVLAGLGGSIIGAVLSPKTARTPKVRAFEEDTDWTHSRDAESGDGHADGSGEDPSVPAYPSDPAARAYVTDGDDLMPIGGATTTLAGRASVPPLWPEPAAPSEGQDPPTDSHQPGR